MSRWLITSLESPKTGKSTNKLDVITSMQIEQMQVHLYLCKYVKVNEIWLLA